MKGQPFLRIVLQLAGLGSAIFANAQSNDFPHSLPTDSDIRYSLSNLVDQNKAVGAVVGIVTPDSRRIIAYGTASPNGPSVTEETIFEIGGVTRIFTCLLLADMVQRGEVNFDDPINRYLPPQARMRTKHGKVITLLDLATQTSGLPFLPGDIRPGEPDFDGGYSQSQLFEFLAAFKVPETVGTKWKFSHLGMGLLARALCYRTSMEYDSLVKVRILDPLGMKSTTIHVTGFARTRMAVGHDFYGEKTEPWWMPDLPGAASLRSTASDLLILLGAFTGKTFSQLTPAMKVMLAGSRPSPGLLQGLGWIMTDTSKGGPLIASAGGTTYGFSCFISFNETTKVGVVVLSNSHEDQGGIGWKIVQSTR